MCTAEYSQAHSIFRSDVFWVNLGTSTFGNSSSAANNSWSRLALRLSSSFSWHDDDDITDVTSVWKLWEHFLG